MNLLTNSGFDEGHHHQDGITEIVVPDGWKLYWLDNETFPGIGEGKALRPESVVWNIEDAPPDEREQFFLDGDYCLKVFKPWAPVYFALAQTVRELEPGQRYRFTVNVFPDIVEEYRGGEKVYADDPWSAEARLGSSAPDTSWPEGEDGDIDWSDWFNKSMGSLEIGAYNEISTEFVAPESGEARVWLECKAKWGFRNNFFMDAFSLKAVGEEPDDEGEEEPTPEATEWDYPVIERGSKLGVHSIFSNQVRGFAQKLVDGGTHFPVVKAVDDLGWLVEIKEVSPDTITIGRLTNARFEEAPDVENEGTDLRVLAEKMVGFYLDKIEEDPRLQEGVDYWEIWNEPDPSGTQGYRRLAELMIETMDLAEEHGLKTALFALNAGTPEWDEMEAMVETGVFARMREGGHILTSHEGVFSADQPIDQYWGDSIPGSPQVEGAGALCFRYRYLYHLLKQRGEVVPLVISEWYGHKGLSIDEALERARWYDEEASKDYWVWAFCPFTLGPSSQWRSHDCEYAYPALIERMISIKGVENAIVSEDGPKPKPPEKERGEPRVQYRRTYVLMPPDADEAWVKAVVDASWSEHKYTVGGSADDAGIGDLEDRTVIAINPSHWRDDLEQYFQTYYPGVHYIPVEAPTPEELITKLDAIDL